MTNENTSYNDFPQSAMNGSVPLQNTPIYQPQSAYPTASVAELKTQKKMNFLYALAGFAAATILVAPVTWAIATHSSGGSSQPSFSNMQRFGGMSGGGMPGNSNGQSGNSSNGQSDIQNNQMPQNGTNGQPNLEKNNSSSQDSDTTTD